jgi:alkylhydroperoxidase/carboxymuconolactone decarboxylase family protein YurZ
MRPPLVFFSIERMRLSLSPHPQNSVISHGVTVEELRELLLHSGIYCGIPAANAAVRIAEDVINETQGGPGPS